jgi:hypothetical protein
MVELVVNNASPRPDYTWVRSNVERALRQLSANLIRITRGAGAPHMLAEQARDLLDAFQEHRDKIGHWPTSAAIHEALEVGQEYRLNENHDLFSDEERFNDERRVTLHHAEETIISGALRIAAARQIGGSPLQLTKGRDEMLKGVRARDEALASRFNPKKAAKQRAEDQRWKSRRKTAEQRAVETEPPRSSIPLPRKEEMTVLARELLENYGRGRYHRVARELWNRGFRKANGGQFSTQEIRDMLGWS